MSINPFKDKAKQIFRRVEVGLWPFCQIDQKGVFFSKTSSQCSCLDLQAVLTVSAARIYLCTNKLRKQMFQLPTVFLCFHSCSLPPLRFGPHPRLYHQHACFHPRSWDSWPQFVFAFNRCADKWQLSHSAIKEDVCCYSPMSLCFISSRW